MPTNPHDALLQECRDLFRDNLIEAVRRTFDGMDKSLMELADRTPNYELRNRYLDARDVALKHREVIEAQFRRRLMAEFESRIDRSKAKPDAPRFELEDLRLVADDDLNETLSFNDMASKMRRHCEDEMQALDQRAAVLLGRGSIEADDNPFGAKVVSDAFKQACQQVDCPLDVRLVFMKSFETLAMEGIRGTCREVNDLLVANAVLPKIRYGVARNESRPKSPAAGAAPGPALAAANEERAGPQQDMFAMLSQMLGGAPAAAGGAIGGGGGGGGSGAGAGGVGVGGMPLLQGQQLLGSLTSLQRGDMSVLDAATAAELAPILAEAGNLQNVLRRLKGTSVGAGMGQVDAMTLEIVSMLFDALFEDPKVPVALKGLIGRLQLPMLKVAIADKDLFSSKTHPARRLLDSFGQLGQRLPRDLGSDNPLFAQLATLVDELVHEFQDNTDVFDAVRIQLEAMISSEDARIAMQMQTSQRELENVETLALAKSEVQEELRARVAANTETPRPVVEFLAQEWIKYLVVVRARDGRDSDAWHAAAVATDRLLWSVQAKSSAEDRRSLTGAIPGLLRALKAGVAAGGIEPEVASAFFAQLMACHTLALRSPVAPPAPAVAAPAGAASASTPAPKKAEPAPEDLLDFTRPVTVVNPFGEGKVEVNDDDLDFTRPVDVGGEAPPPTLEPVDAAANARPVRPAQKVRLPSAMVVDAWVRIEDKESRTDRAARLHYVSPLKSHFLFVDRQGNKVYECSRTMLARRIKLGEVSLLEGEPDASLFDRIMEGIFGKLRRPATEPVAA